MAIKRIKIKDFLVFKSEFTIDFCPGVNVIIGGNGTGKSTILRAMYGRRDIIEMTELSEFARAGSYRVERTEIEPLPYDDIKLVPFDELFDATNFAYIPEKDVLEHSRGLLHFIETKLTGFGRVYKDVLLKAQDVPTANLSITQQTLCKKLEGIMGGTVQYDMSDGCFYMVSTDGKRIPFSHEASGFKKLGFLWLLIICGQLEPGSVLFWDEPENSLNPELVPLLVDILLELSRNSVQIFVATHSELLASYFAVNRVNMEEVLFISLYKEGDIVKANTGDRFDWLEPNNLTEEPVRLYEKKLDKGLGSNG